MADPVVRVVEQEADVLTPDTAAARVLDGIPPDASIVLIGEATHGTHEFYRLRADVTRLLIERRGFSIVAVEADWPDAYRANRWARLQGDDETAENALSDFTRFPRWMWRNREVVRFLRWLRGHNTERALPTRVGFHGLDLYSLHRSIDCVIEYLEKVDPHAASLARQRYGCFDIFGDDPQRYGYATSARLAPSCEDPVVRQLMHLQRSAAEYAQRDGYIAADESGIPMFMVRLATPTLRAALATPRLERAIGVIYKPEMERGSHYFEATLPDQFDLVVHIDQTRALEPLEKWARHEVDLPETYPTGV